ncbi:hypothetical protein [Rhizobium etli]|uniref:hypothetical protein n=1 Tax=Rhizobium etli TaxID=29449 RepID=UPI0012BC13DF|nr:hypothetical protein [Rhizobium etli]
MLSADHKRRGSAKASGGSQGRCSTLLNEVSPSVYLSMSKEKDDIDDIEVQMVPGHQDLQSHSNGDNVHVE